MGKKLFDHGPGETNQETTDAAAHAGSDHNEALAQRPKADDKSEAAEAWRLRHQSEAIGKTLTQGQTTTTTPDSVRGDAPEGRSIGELDARGPQERIEQIRGWGKQVRLGGPRQADWEKFDELTGSDDHDPASPAPVPKSGEDRRP